jgi:hypothetical protein
LPRDDRFGTVINMAKNSPVVTTPESSAAPPVSLPFRPVATQVTHEANPTMICIYEARATDGRIIQLQLTNGLQSVTWDGSLNEDGSPKVHINANVNASAQWKPEPAPAPVPAPN